MIIGPQDTDGNPTHLTLAETTARIRGKVTLGGVGLAGARVSMSVRRSDGVVDTFGTQTNGEGTFVLRTVAAMAATVTEVRP